MGENKTPERVERGKTMKRIRVINGMSQQYVTLVTGISSVTMVRLENGLTGGRLEVLLKMSQLYGVTLSKMIGET